MAVISLFLCLFANFASAKTFTVPIEVTPPSNASDIVPKNFLSLSIESSSFPDFGGNDTHPNVFTKNLISNLVEETEELPIIRVGGATAERSLFVADQKEALIPYWDYSYNLDQPKNMTIGPAYWQSLSQLQETARFVFDLNFVKNDSGYIYNLRACVNETFEQVDHDKIYLWEIGNENDVDVSQRFRPANWTVDDFVEEWVNRSRAINAEHDDQLRFMAPSLSGLNADFSPYRMLDPNDLDMDRDKWISEISHHMYITGAQNRPELQSTLMNHSTLIKAAYWPLDFGNRMRNEGRSYILGECNSIYGQGAASVSDVFGATLWNVDFALYMAANNVRRVQMHQGTSYRYASWLPIQVNETAPHVRPPYYANVFVSRFIGPSGNTRIANFPLDDHVNVAYAAYENDDLARIVFLNMEEYNATKTDDGRIACRPRTTFRFPAPPGHLQARVARLWAPDAHEFTDITIDGVSYSYADGLGKPIRVRDDAKIINAKDGEFAVKVEASGAVMITLL